MDTKLKKHNHLSWFERRIEGHPELHLEQLPPLTLATLDGTKMQCRTTLHAELKEKLLFPEYYGENLDALWDCATDITDETIIIWHQYDESNATTHGYAAKALEILCEAHLKYSKIRIVTSNVSATPNSTFIKIRIHSNKYGYIDIQNPECIMSKCRTCGYDYSKYNFYPWGESCQTPDFDICECCGTEFGNANDDFLYEGIIEYRRQWLEKGAPWFGFEKPEDWDIALSLAGLPAELFDTDLSRNPDAIPDSPYSDHVLTSETRQRIQSMCRVCGNEKHNTVGGYCPCCGFEFGYGDWRLAGLLKYRHQWIASGAKWIVPVMRPSGWRLEETLARLPQELLAPAG